MVYNVKVFCYADNKQQIRFYSNDIHVNDSITELIEEKRSITKSVKKDNGIESNKDFSCLVSQKRTINEIYNITRSNIWDYFITLTFNPQRVNRYDFDSVVEAAGKYFNFLRKEFDNDIKYFLVPEKHQDGAWHIHGLVASDKVQIVDSGHIDKKGRVIYHMPHYIYGFSDATRVSNNFAACSYMTKYVTKDLCFDTMYRNRYIVSKNVGRAKEKEFRISADRFKKVVSEFDNVIFSKTVQTGEEFVYYIETENQESVFEFLSQELDFDEVD